MTRLLLFGVAVLVSSDAWAKRPNIVFAFADDWGRYAGAYAKIDGAGTPNDVIRTPNFDRVAREGVLFRNAFVTAPSCTPCRSSLLSGQYFYRCGRGAILQGAIWDAKIPSYPLLLQKAGYHVGFSYKVWSPGSPANAPYGVYNGYNRRGRRFGGFSQTATNLIKRRNKTIAEAKAELGKEVTANFEDFLSRRNEGQPFCYWFGPTNVHRKWIAGSGKKLWGINPDDLKGKLPPFLPDVPVVRQDFADYLGEAMAFDMALGLLLKKLEAMDELDNTLVVVSGDHGAPGFPRGKCNLYDFGVAVPLAMRWGKNIKPERVLDDFVNLMDLAPTFLEAGGVKVPTVMTGRSLVPVLKSEKQGLVDAKRSWVITGRERHVAAARAGNLPYPQRAIRTKDHLYIINFRPDRTPMGDPKAVTNDSAPSTQALTNNTFIAFGDLDASPTKAWVINNRKTQKKYFDLAFAKRPREELYDLSKDPHQITNVAGNKRYAEIQRKLNQQLMAELKRTGDPRVTGKGDTFEKPPFTGEFKRRPRRNKAAGVWKKHTILPPANSGINSAVAADFDKDGHMDVLSSFDSKVVLFRGPKWKPTTIHAFARPQRAACIHSCLMDVDGDGDLDFCGSNNSVFWLECPKKPFSGEKWKFRNIDNKIRGTHCLITGDVNKDGKPDLIANSNRPTGTPFPNSIVWLEVPKNPHKADEWVRHVFAKGDAPGASHYMGLGDVNGDGRPDICCGAKGGKGFPGGEWFAWWEQPKDPRGVWKKHLLSDKQPGASNIDPLDINRDGKMDFIATRGHSKGLLWFKAPEFKPIEIDPEIDGPHCLVLADIDGDGDIDAATCGRAQTGMAAWYENKGRGRFTRHTIGTNQGSYDIRAVDLDGDKDLDLLIAGHSSRNIVWYENPLR